MEPVTAVYAGPLLHMFRDVLAYYRERIPDALWDREKEAACWLQYEGDDCAPFRGFFRFRKTKAVIANIFAIGPDDQIYRKGRMPKIIEALSQINSTVEVESVINSNLSVFLVSQGFMEDRERPGTFVKVFP